MRYLWKVCGKVFLWFMSWEQLVTQIQHNMGLMKEIIRIHHTFFFLLIRHNKAWLSSVSKVSGYVETWMLKISFWSVWISINTTIKFYCFETRNKNPSAVNSFNIFLSKSSRFFLVVISVARFRIHITRFFSRSEYSLQLFKYLIYLFSLELLW